MQYTHYKHILQNHGIANTIYYIRIYVFNLYTQGIQFMVCVIKEILQNMIHKVTLLVFYKYDLLAKS